MNTPTKEQRAKIDQAIDTVTSICSSGKISPSKAIAKVASDMKLTADYLPIIVRAYNTGAATVHREDSHTLQEKAASYPIAYLDEVLSLLQKNFPMNKKAFAERPRDTFWEYNANYYFPNAWDHIVDTSESSMWDVKQASVKRCTVAKDNIKKNVNSTAKRTADEVTRIKYAAEEDKNKALSEVERVLCQNSGIKLATARQYASASYGKEGLAVIDKLITVNNLEKTAQYRRETYIPTDHPFAKAFEDFVLKNEDFKKAASTERKVLEQCITVLNENVRPKDRYMNNDAAIDAMFKEGEMKRRKKDMYKPYQKKKEEFLKEAYRPLSESGVGGITGLEQLNHPGWVGLDRFERELMYGLADPAHEAKLRNIRVQTILTDLMNTDPYLKDKDPEEVIDAMNDIMEINPDLHKNKPMLRIALRQFLESDGMDIPTLGVLSEFGKEERERKSREQGQRESAAQQFASQQESARQADEKLRSEEERAREDREARERENEAQRQFQLEEGRRTRHSQDLLEALRREQSDQQFWDSYDQAARHHAADIAERQADRRQRDTHHNDDRADRLADRNQRDTHHNDDRADRLADRNQRDTHHNDDRADRLADRRQRARFHKDDRADRLADRNQRDTHHNDDINQRELDRQQRENFHTDDNDHWQKDHDQRNQFHIEDRADRAADRTQRAQFHKDDYNQRNQFHTDDYNQRNQFHTEDYNQRDKHQEQQHQDNIAGMNNQRAIENHRAKSQEAMAAMEAARRQAAEMQRQKFEAEQAYRKTMADFYKEKSKNDTSIDAFKNYNEYGDTLENLYKKPTGTLNLTDPPKTTRTSKTRTVPDLDPLT